MTLHPADPGEVLTRGQTGRDDLVQDVQTSWSRFSRHAAECEACSLLARYVRRQVGKPPEIAVLACCEPGRDLAAAWIHACGSLIAYFNRLRVV